MKCSDDTVEFLKANSQIDENGIVTCFKSVNEEIIQAVQERVLDIEREFIDEYEIEREKLPKLTESINDTVSKEDIEPLTKMGYSPLEATLYAIESMNKDSRHAETRWRQLQEFRTWFKKESLCLVEKDGKLSVTPNKKFYWELLNWQRSLVLYPDDNPGGVYCVAVLVNGELVIKTTTFESFVTVELNENEEVILSIMGMKKINLGKYKKWNGFMYKYLSEHPEGVSAEVINKEFQRITDDKGAANITQKVTELNDKLTENGFSYTYRVQAKKTGNKVDCYYIPYFKYFIVVDVNAYETIWDKAFNGDEDAIVKMDGDSMFKYGRVYEYGEGVDKDLVKAKEWFERASSKGHAEAMAHLGLILLEEDEKNAHRVVELYNKSADLGCSIAQYHLGMMYKEGKFVEQDISKAVALFEACASPKTGALCATDARRELWDYYSKIDKDKALAFFTDYITKDLI